MSVTLNLKTGEYEEIDPTGERIALQTGYFSVLAASTNRTAVVPIQIIRRPSPLARDISAQHRL